MAAVSVRPPLGETIVRSKAVRASWNFACAINTAFSSAEAEVPSLSSINAWIAGFKSAIAR